MARYFACIAISLLVGCDVEDRQATRSTPVERAESPNETVAYSVGEMTFSVPGKWTEATTNTPATKLFLVIPDGQGGASGMIKVDVGWPVEDGLAANAEAIESRFDGKSTEILGGSVVLTSTTSTSVEIPRHIFTTLIEGQVYFVFIAADSPDAADEACESIRKTMQIAPDNRDTGEGR